MLKTEMRNPNTTHIDKMSPYDIVEIMNRENLEAVQAVQEQLQPISRAVEAITAALKCGGRLFYIGAGTSGRLGVLDAAECPPTFGIPQGVVIGVIAGGDASLRTASETAEDDPAAGIRDLQAYQLNGQDVVVGISAAGGAKYVLTALEYAKSLGCRTIGISSNPGSPLDTLAEIPICTDTGAEVISGSTRLKAGSAQKLVLNMLSTASMIRCGYVYENFMINLKPANQKLKQRMVGIVCQMLECEESRALEYLEENSWSIPKVLDARGML